MEAIMGKRNKVTTRDIAEYAGVSQSTVSMILSEKKNVSFGEETVEKVKNAAKTLGYHKPCKKKRTPDRSLSKTVMILCPTVSNGYYNAVIHSIVEKAQEYDYTTLTAVTFRSAEREDAYFKIFAENELAGVVSLYPLTKYTEANVLAKRVPVVSIGEKPEGIRFSSVELDSQKPGWMMAEHLVKLGHRHIAFISAPVVKKEISRTRRLAGLQKYYREAGLDPSLIKVFCPTQKTYEEYPHTGAEYRTGYEMAIRALEADTPATAFVGNSDDIAFGILAALADRGIRVPGDISVAGFDNNTMLCGLSDCCHNGRRRGKDESTRAENNHHCYGSDNIICNDIRNDGNKQGKRNQPACPLVCNTLGRCLIFFRILYYTYQPL